MVGNSVKKRYHGKLIEMGTGKIILILTSNIKYVDYVCYKIEEMTYFDIQERTIDYMLVGDKWKFL